MQINYTSTGSVNRTLTAGLYAFSEEKDSNVQEAVSENRQARVLTIHGSRPIYTVGIQYFDRSSIALMQELREAIEANHEIILTDPDDNHPEFYFPIYGRRTTDPTPSLRRMGNCDGWQFEFKLIGY